MRGDFYSWIHCRYIECEGAPTRTTCRADACCIHLRPAHQIVDRAFSIEDFVASKVLAHEETLGSRHEMLHRITACHSRPGGGIVVLHPLALTNWIEREHNEAFHRQVSR